MNGVLKWMSDVLKLLDGVKQRALQDNVLSLTELVAIVSTPIKSLVDTAHEVTLAKARRKFNFSTVFKINSVGYCKKFSFSGENFAQHSLLESKTIIERVLSAQKFGVTDVSLVVNDSQCSSHDVTEIATVVKELRKHCSKEVSVCAGIITEKDLRKLAQAGVSRYHCQLPKAERSHNYDGLMTTVQAAQRVGMAIGSYCIFDVRETCQDRIEQALTCRRFSACSITIDISDSVNFHVSENHGPLLIEEIIRTIALFRLTNPTADLYLIGLRGPLSEEITHQILLAGVNGVIMGDDCDRRNNVISFDQEQIKRCGYQLGDELGLHFDREHIWHPYASTLHAPRVEKVVGGQGVYIQLADGRELIDGTSSWWCAAHGYRHPALVQAVQRQAETLSHVMFAGLTHNPAIELAKKLLRIVPKGLEKIFYADSGSVAIEAAMKMAVQYQIARGEPQKINFVTIKGGYHGDTWNAMSVCDPIAGMHSLFGASLPVRYFIASPSSDFGTPWHPEDLEPLQKILQEQKDIGALILEPIFQGASAMRFYHPAFLREASKLCRQHGVLLIADEIATGFGRTGKTFACDWAEVCPDIMTVGKGLTGGMMTLSAVLCTNAVADTISGAQPSAFMHGPTFMANPLACAAACASLTLFEQTDYLAEVKRIERGLMEGLMPLKAIDGVKDVRVLGAIGVVELQRSVESEWIQERFVREGVWVRPIGPLCYLMPPFIITDKELQHLTLAVQHVLKQQIRRQKEGN